MLKTKKLSSNRPLIITTILLLITSAFCSVLHGIVIFAPLCQSKYKPLTPSQNAAFYAILQQSEKGFLYDKSNVLLSRQKSGGEIYYPLNCGIVFQYFAFTHRHFYCFTTNGKSKNMKCHIRFASDNSPIQKLYRTRKIGQTVEFVYFIKSSDKIRKFLCFIFRRTDIVLFAGFNRFKHPRHILSESTHSLQTFLVLSHIISSKTVNLVPIL